MPELNNLLATDARFNGWVELQTEDGAYFFYPHSFFQIEKDEDSIEWVVVYSEHNVTHLYLKASIDYVNASKYIPESVTYIEEEYPIGMYEFDDEHTLEKALENIQTRVTKEFR